jgi:hypothetical protein
MALPLATRVAACRFVVTIVGTLDESMHDSAALIAFQINRESFLAAFYPRRIPTEGLLIRWPSA